MNPDALFRLWGKTIKGSDDPYIFHPAIFHMLDTGNIAKEFMCKNVSPRWRNVIANVLNTSAESLIDFIPYFVALHDIGKISSAFQSLNVSQMTRLQQEGFVINQSHIRHSVISQNFIADLLTRFSGNISNTLLGAVNEAMGGHHGRFIDTEEVKKARYYLKNEPAEWQILRQNADLLLQNEFLHYNLKSVQPANISTAIMAITGFTILCDWLSSDERYFIPASNTVLEEYLKESRVRAKRAAADSGMLSPVDSEAPINVESLFQDLGTLRPLQLAVNDIPNQILDSPSLTIIEAPTGEGKTEAALALAHRIAKIHGTDEMYYALPTMATSNQMFSRLQTHLEKRLHLAASIKLVHGQAFLVEDELRSEMPASLIQPLEDDGTGDTFEVNEVITWFNSKKRALLAPFGVGTIDQAELAAMNVKHAALRMMGMTGKVVIIDEVHAYDTYMTTIIERLLCWLSAMGTSVILLSATLPQSRRLQLAQAYGINLSFDKRKSEAYPSLLVLTNIGVHHSTPQVWQPNRTIELSELHWDDEDKQSKADWLLDTIVNGGCVCWITNTVKRAQRIFESLLNILPSDVDLSLLHSQFPLDERQRREQELNAKYGRNGKRPQRGIVIGTQVLEQSLDLDFDLMVTDLAPIDLTLQRAGRLHRHDRQRPTAYAVPHLYINFEITSDGNLKLGSDQSIYAEYFMRKTYQILAKRSQIRLPSDYRILIEAVYASPESPVDEALYKAWNKLQNQQNLANSEAKQRLLPAPHPRDSFAKNAAARIVFEEDENRADWIVAQTRLGEETLNVIPIERKGDFGFLPGEKIRININEEALLDNQRRLLKRNLRISHPEVIQAIRVETEKNGTVLFNQSNLLKGYHPLWLLNGKKEVKFEQNNFHISLDPQLGLVIEKEDNPNGNTE